MQKWEVYKSRRAGRCRLCAQVVQYEDNLSRVGVLTLKYRDDLKIDATLRGDYLGIDAPSIEKRAEWIASSEVSAEPLAEGLLEPPPILRVADRARSVNFIDDIITAYDELTKGRFYIRAQYPDDNCIERSKKLFQGKTIQAVCHVRYLEQVLRGGEKSMEALRIGSSITRIILADTRDELVKFLEKDIGGAKCRDLLANFFESYPQTLRILALDERQFDINMIIKGKLLDFALVSESSPKFSFLLVSNLAAPGIGPQGFISWRRMDIEFYNYLWDCLNSEAQLRTPEALRNANYL
jgi:hypothetical protein